MTIGQIFDAIIEKNASDAFISVGSFLKLRICNEVENASVEEITIKDVEKVLAEILDDESKEIFAKNKSYEFAMLYKEDWRFRISVFYQKNTPAIVIRKIALKDLDFDKLNLPAKVLQQFASQRRGLVLLTGMSGSGKSTTIAAMVEHINQNFKRHIITIEDPIEFTFQEKKALINQRQVGKDVDSFEEALRQSTLHCPDVIYIGNIRDKATCHAALTAAETGVLVLSTVHTINAYSTIERLVSFFPAEQQDLVFSQLSFLLKGVISTRLLPRSDVKGLIPSYEIMTLSPTVSSLIKEHELGKLYKSISTSEIFGMNTFNQCLLGLIEEGKISPEVALANSDEKKELKLALQDKNINMDLSENTGFASPDAI